MGDIDGTVVHWIAMFFLCFSGLRVLWLPPTIQRHAWVTLMVIVLNVCMNRFLAPF